MTVNIAATISTLPLERAGYKLIARHRDHHHVNLEFAGLQVLVQIVLEDLQPLVGQAALLPFVDEVVRAVERDGHADCATLHQFVEVAGERRIHREAHGWREGIVRRSRLDGGRYFRRRLGRRLGG